jgi:hypothetical protein
VTSGGIVEQEAHQQPFTLRVSMHLNQCEEVAGSTTFAKDAVAALTDRKGVGERDYYEDKTQLQQDPENPSDPQAVAVLVDGEKVGCLPAYAAKHVDLPVGASARISCGNRSCWRSQDDQDGAVSGASDAAPVCRLIDRGS